MLKTTKIAPTSPADTVRTDTTHRQGQHTVGRPTRTLRLTGTTEEALFRALENSEKGTTFVDVSHAQKQEENLFRWKSYHQWVYPTFGTMELEIKNRIKN